MDGTRYQRNPIYSLVVGDGETGVEINNLHIEFEVTKTSNNKEKKNQARVRIFNLSEERRKFLEQEYIAVSLSVGYADIDNGAMSLLFAGQLTQMKVKEGWDFLTERSGNDIITTLTIDELFKELNGRQVSSFVPAGKTIKDVVITIADNMPEITRREITGSIVNTEVPDGYPLSGTPRQLLDKLSRDYAIEWQIDSACLYVSDKDGTTTSNTSQVPLISEMSGLIGRPHAKSEDVKRLRLKGDNTDKKTKGRKIKRPTLNAKILLNPTIIAGSTIKLEYGDLTGFYKVDEVTHKGEYYGNEWSSELILSGLQTVEE